MTPEAAGVKGSTVLKSQPFQHFKNLFMVAVYPERRRVASVRLCIQLVSPAESLWNTSEVCGANAVR